MAGSRSTQTEERAIRPICRSRKNGLRGSGGDGGARLVTIASRVQACHLNGMDPRRAFAEVLPRPVNG